MYGPTEAAISVTYEHCLEERSVSLGRPIPTSTAYVFDQAGHQQPLGMPGELYLGGAQLARGYLGGPDLTAEKFVEHDLGRLYRTGDRAVWGPDGRLQFLGRLDDQVKLRGFRIELGEVEAVLVEHGGVSQACVVVAEGGSGEALLAAYVVVAPGFDGGVAGGGWRVDEWRSVAEQNYGEAVGVDPWFDTRGWVSSFTGEPITASLMREWVGATVERIAGLGGRSVVPEVGSGSGLLVGWLAWGADPDVATDFSAAAVDRLAGLVADAGWEWVSVARLAGDEVSGEVVGSGFDVVVVKMVAQYFPDRAYAVGVFDRAVSVAGTGGRVFVGDVRDLRLHQAFGLAVELARGPAVSATELAVRVAERTGADAELLFDPAVFFDVAAVSHVQVLPKRGRGPQPDDQVPLRRGLAHRRRGAGRTTTMGRLGRPGLVGR